MLTILIVDDETLARDTIRLLLSNQPDINIVGEASDGKKAKKMALELRPHILFLDIEMPGISGIELARELPPECVIIFVTAYNQHAVTAFELNAIDYLLKPYEDERFYEALSRARAKVKDRQLEDYSKLGDTLNSLLMNQQKSFRERLVVRDPGRIRFIEVKDILFITGAGNYAEIHLNEGAHLLHRETLSALGEQLDPAIFVRIHRSSIVRRSSITELIPNEKGDYSVILNTGQQLTLSRRNRAKLGELMQ